MENNEKPFVPRADRRKIARAEAKISKTYTEVYTELVNMLFAYNWDIFDPTDSFCPFGAFNIVFREEVKKKASGQKVTVSDSFYRRLCEDACNKPKWTESKLWAITDRLIGKIVLIN